VEVTLEADRFELMGRWIDGLADVVKLSLPAGVTLARCQADTFWRESEEDIREREAKEEYLRLDREMQGETRMAIEAEAYRRGYESAQHALLDAQIDHAKAKLLPPLPDVDLKLESKRIRATGDYPHAGPTEEEINAELAKVQVDDKRSRLVPLDDDPTVEVDQRTQKHKPYPDDPTLAEVVHQAQVRVVDRYLGQKRPISDNPQA
jgi:hypothetical protein